MICGTVVIMSNVDCIFINSDDILTPNHLKYYFCVSSTASFLLACQKDFYFCLQHLEDITFNNIF